MSFNVYAYNVPRVSEDGSEALPTAEGEKDQFSEIDAARAFAQARAERFDRVVLVEKADDGQRLVERYVNGGFERAEEIVRH